jgi:putative Mg2+ transporter-C (MgtC) family protein
MEQFWQVLVADWPGSTELLTVGFRLILAALVGALPGLQRERVHVAAGLRTHMLVSLGSAIFVLAALDTGATIDATTRVIQGLATGIGFVGAGAILKSAQNQEIRGLTTAASIWLTAGLGTAVGVGRIWLPLFGSLLALIVLSLLRRFESHGSGLNNLPPQPGSDRPNGTRG